MNLDESDSLFTETPEAPDSARGPTSGEDVLTVLQRIEQGLAEIRRSLDGMARERRHREFSPARLIGSILQAFVVGLVLWSVSDWVFGEPRDALLVKIAFAAVLQLGALTAFLLGREVD